MSKCSNFVKVIRKHEKKDPIVDAFLGIVTSENKFSTVIN